MYIKLSTLKHYYCTSVEFVVVLEDSESGFSFTVFSSKGSVFIVGGVLSLLANKKMILKKTFQVFR